MHARTIRLALTGTLTAGVSLGLAGPATSMTLETTGMRPTATSHASAARPSDPTVIGDIAPKRLNGERQMSDLGEYTNTPTVLGAQVCDPANDGAQLPIAGRGWMYYDSEDDTSGLSTDLEITGWTDAASAFADITANTGLCNLVPGWSAHVWPGVDASTHLLLVTADGVEAAAVIRVGDRLVAVSVFDWDGGADVVGAATSAATSVAKRVR